MWGAGVSEHLANLCPPAHLRAPKPGSRRGVWIWVEWLRTIYYCHLQSLAGGLLEKRVTSLGHQSCIDIGSGPHRISRESA